MSRPESSGRMDPRLRGDDGVELSVALCLAGLLLGGGGVALGGGQLGRIAGGLLGDTRRLAAAITQIIELGATDVTTADHFDLGDIRGVEREDTLDAFAVGDLAHGERAVQAGIAAGDDDALVSLQTLAGAFDHLDVDLDGVARGEVRDRLAGGELGDLLLLQRLNNVRHDLTLLSISFCDVSVPKIGAP